MSDWTNSHDLVYAFVCVSFLADGDVDESEKEAMRGNVKVMLPDMGDDEYHQVEKEVIDKFIALGDEASRFDQYGSSLSAIKEMFSSDDDRYKVIKNLAYIARADEFIHENEMKMMPPRGPWDPLRDSKIVNIRKAKSLKNHNFSDPHLKGILDDF